MRLPKPRPGLVIRYSFLWSAEADRGVVEDRKDRPCAIVAPITHSPPVDPSTSLEIPAQTCGALGLDEGRHWLRFDELNRFDWPGFDLRPGPDGRYDYGMLPPGLFEELRRGILDLWRARRGRVVGRDE